MQRDLIRKLLRLSEREMDMAFSRRMVRDNWVIFNVEPIS